MFDKKYMDSRDKPLESIEDALMVIAAKENCGGVNCSECALTMYGNGCGTYVDKAYKILFERFGIRFGKHGLTTQQSVYDQIFRAGKVKEVTWVIPSGAVRTGKETCETCQHSRMAESGIRFCGHFFNFVHKDGFCYKYKPVKMEIEETVDLPPKAPKPTPDPGEEIPF